MYKRNMEENTQGCQTLLTDLFYNTLQFTVDSKHEKYPSGHHAICDKVAGWKNLMLEIPRCYQLRHSVSRKLSNEKRTDKSFQINQARGGGGTWDFKWRGWSNGAKSQDPKASLGLPAKSQKIPGPKLTPKKSHADFVALKSSKFQCRQLYNMCDIKRLHS